MSKDKNNTQETLDFSKKSKNKKVVRTSIASIVFFVLGLTTLLSSFGSAGKAGQAIFNFLTLLFGWFAYLLFMLFFFVGYYLWKEKEEKKIDVMTTISVLIILFSLTSFTASINIHNSGIIGNYLHTFLANNLGNILPAVVSFAIGLIAFIFLYEDKPKISINNEKLKNINGVILEKTSHTSKNIFRKLLYFFKNIFKKNSSTAIVANKEIIDMTEDYNHEPQKNLHGELMRGFEKRKDVLEETESTGNNSQDVKVVESKELQKAIEKTEEERKKSVEEEMKPIVIEERFTPPDLSLLNTDSGKSSAGDSKFKMNVIQKVLDQFNIPVEMGEVTVGPSVTQFTLKPAQGVNVKKILGLKDNLQMALSATNMHIEAPIPGKPFVGIEIPNEKKSMLGLRSLIELKEFQEGPSLSLAIGKNIIGKPVISDLTKMPHLLVAGATGTGKSVTLHNLILSLLYKNSPYDLKLIILDPKRVEFTTYNSLPHLYTPIIKDAKTAIKSLNWAAQEMDRRYDVLGEYGVPNIGDYNKKVFFPALEKAKKKSNDGDLVKGLPPKMPYIVIVFDEFNDFMLSYPKEITPIITSLSQKARAAGIHLILTTQRPDVKVITGTIKANIPSRIALKTTSQIDSRTILDQAGAEDLLGNGDMLYMNGSTITRVQAPFVSSEEIKEVISDIKKRYSDFVPDSIDIHKVKISSSPTSGMREMEDGEARNPSEEPTDDEDYMSARDYVISTGKASTSSLQTAFRWGYNKSARIINDLEMYGIIGPATNGRHREVLYGKNNESEVEKLEKELNELETNNSNNKE